jgi:hypothetical protein
VLDDPRDSTVDPLVALRTLVVTAPIVPTPGTVVAAVLSELETPEEVVHSGMSAVAPEVTVVPSRAYEP